MSCRMEFGGHTTRLFAHISRIIRFVSGPSSRIAIARWKRRRFVRNARPSMRSLSSARLYGLPTQLREQRQGKRQLCAELLG